MGILSAKTQKVRTHWSLKLCAAELMFGCGLILVEHLQYELRVCFRSKLHYVTVFGPVGKDWTCWDILGGILGQHKKFFVTLIMILIFPLILQGDF